MTYIYIGAAITFGTLAGIVAYLYYEGAALSGQSEIGLGPLKIKVKARSRE